MKSLSKFHVKIKKSQGGYSVNLSGENIGDERGNLHMCFSQIFPQVTSLNLCDNKIYELTCNDFLSLKKFFPNTSKVILNSNDASSNKDFLYLISQAFPNAEKLFISNSNIGYLDFNHFSSTVMANVLELSMNDNDISKLNDNQVKLLASAFPNLKSLSICNNGLKTEKILQFLTMFKTIESLSARHNDVTINQTFVSKLEKIISYENFNIESITILKSETEKPDKDFLMGKDISDARRELQHQAVCMALSGIFKQSYNTETKKYLANEMIAYLPGVNIY